MSAGKSSDGGTSRRSRRAGSVSSASSSNMRSAPQGYTLVATLVDSNATRVVQATRDVDGQSVIIHSDSDRDLTAMYELLRQLTSLGIAPRPLGMVSWRGHMAVVAGAVRGVTAAELAESNDGVLPVEVLVPVCVAITRAIAVLHSDRIIHKDLRPESIMLDTEPPHEATIINFGMAADFQASTAMGGTLPYMAPEQTGRLDVLPDYRCDLYSLGATMYRLATGRAPHTADTVSVLVHLKLCEDPKPVCVVNTAVPKPLSDVIGRLLQRQADQRYQSAYGALRDLLQCEAAMRGECKFPKKLATVDVPMRLRPVTTILGRDDEFERLQSCFQRAQAGDASCVLLSGVSGVGKSSLVSHMVGQLPRHALFGAGKCDAGMASMPGWVFAQALAVVIRGIMSLSRREVQACRDRVKAALENEASVMCDVFPALSNLIGEQPPSGVMPPAETARRLHRLFIALLMALGSKSRPLVLMLDDVQWAGPFSTRLLKVLLTSAHVRHLMVVVSYRSNEVPDSHPIAQMLQQVEAASTAATRWQRTRIRLAPLGAPAVTKLVSYQLWGSNPAGLDELVREIHARTSGIPFLVLQFVKTLFDERVLRHTPTGAWFVDVERATSFQHTDNVGLVLRNLATLPDESRRCLQVASCFGQRFSAVDIASATGADPARVLTHMREAMQSALLACAAATVDVNMQFTFYHDRVREAVQTLVTAEQAQELHLVFGRRAVKAMGRISEATDAQLFDAVGHLVHARERVTSKPERHHVASLLLAAARRSAASTSNAEAIDFASAGLDFINGKEGCWEWTAVPTHPDDPPAFELAFGLMSILGSSCRLEGRFAEADMYIAHVLRRSRSAVEKAQVLSIQLGVVFASGKTDEAYQIGRQAMELLGVPFPEPTADRALAMAGDIVVRLADYTVARLRTATPCTKPNVLQAYKTIGHMIAPGFYLPDPYFTTLLCVGVDLTLREGPAPEAAVPLAFWALVLQIMGQCDTAFELGRFALDLVEPCTDDTARGRTYLCYGAHVNWLRNPLADDRQYVNKALPLLLRSGANIFAWGCVGNHRMVDILSGVPVQDWTASAVADAILTRDRLFYSDGVEVFLSIVVLARRVSGQDAHNVETVLTETEEEYEKRLYDTMPIPITCFYAALKVFFCCIVRDFAGAKEAAATAIAQESGMRGQVTIPLTYTFSALARLLEAADIPTADENGADANTEARRKYLIAQADAHNEQVRVWVAKSEVNFKTYGQLVATQRAIATRTDADVIITMLDELLEECERSGICFLIATACEIGARYYLRKKWKSHGMLLVSKAYAKFCEWGAHTKAQALVEEFGTSLQERPARTFRRPHVITAAPNSLAADTLSQLESVRSGGDPPGATYQHSATPMSYNPWQPNRGNVGGTVSVSASDAVAVDATVDLESMMEAATALAREHTVRGVITVLMKAVTANTAAECAVFVVRGLEDTNEEPQAPAGPTVLDADTKPPASAASPRAAAGGVAAGAGTGAGAGAGAGAGTPSVTRPTSNGGVRVGAVPRSDASRAKNKPPRPSKRYRRCDSGDSHHSTATASSRYARAESSSQANGARGRRGSVEASPIEAVVQATCFDRRHPQFLEELEPLTKYADRIAADVARACFNTRSVILLSDATTDPTFRSDRFVAATGLKSVLCVPVFNKDEFAGVLYLHNASFHGAFMPRRVPMLNILTTQMAISLENAEALSQLTHNNKELERLGSVKDRFLATTSHELRTPLNGILGTASMLVDTALDVEQREYVDTIVSSGELLRSLLTDLIDLSKLQSGRMNLVPAPLEFSALLEHCVAVLSPLGHQKGLQVVLVDHTLASHANPTPAAGADGAAASAKPVASSDDDGLRHWWVRADQSRLQQVVLNLVNNAIKFTMSGSVTVTASVDDAAVAPEGHVMFEIRVQDTGIGIKPDDQRRIFDMFQQVDMRDQRRFGGSGIGLALCRLLMEAMGGSIGVESDGRTGSCFSVRVPLPVIERRPLPTSNSLNLGTRVLVMDRRSDVSTALSAVLEDAGAVVVTEVAPTSDAALLALRPHLTTSADAPGFTAAVVEAPLLTLDLLDECQASGTRVLVHGQRFAWTQEQRTHPGMTRLSSSAAAASVVLAIVQLSDDPDRLAELEADLERRSRATSSRADTGSRLAVSSTRPESVLKLPVLVVDDQKVNLKMMERMLVRCGYEVITAMDGKEAVTMANRSSFSVILMDVMMPIMNGLDATKHIRMNDTITPIVGVTASVAAEDIADCQRVGMTSFLPKPITKRQVLQVVKQYAKPSRQPQVRSSKRKASRKALIASAINPPGAGATGAPPASPTGAAPVADDGSGAAATKQ